VDSRIQVQLEGDGGGSTRQSRRQHWFVPYVPPGAIRQRLSQVSRSHAAFILNWELTPMSTSVAAGLNLQAAGSCAI